MSECIRAHLHMYIHGIYISLSVRGVLQEFHHLIINIYEKLVGLYCYSTCIPEQAMTFGHKTGTSGLKVVKVLIVSV